jgi:quercetin dioxygenase-like cupin family protein
MQVITAHDVGVLDSRSEMYPSIAHVIENHACELTPYSTTFGVVLHGHVSINGREIHTHEFFSIPTVATQTIQAHGRTVLFSRLGFMGQHIVAGKVDIKGRVSYIDGCTDSVLVYPPRKGDACLNSLYFPSQIDQTWHTHPTVRLGCVIAGQGVSHTRGGDFALNTGDVFMIEPHELHKFSTMNSDGMTIVAYHPDSDFGPTDEDHPMKNKTFISTFHKGEQ